MYIILSILLVLAILYIVCVNTLDKWRFRADRQYPYVRELMDEWEQVTRRLLDAAGGQVPDVHVAGQKHPWDAVAAADQLAAACHPPSAFPSWPARPSWRRSWTSFWRSTTGWPAPTTRLWAALWSGSWPGSGAGNRGRPWTSAPGADRAPILNCVKMPRGRG